jgi:hypothetical protein
MTASATVRMLTHALIGVFATAMTLAPSISSAQVNTVVTDGVRPFAEGILSGYEVQADGRTICKNPIVYGRYISCKGRGSRRVSVETNGVLGGYVVVAPHGKPLCSDPTVHNQFRGSTSYILCE